MRAQTLDHMFHNLSFQKSADEITLKADEKVTALKAKIEERIKRVAKIREEYGIDDTALIQILTEARKQAQNPRQDKMSYSFTNSAPEGQKMEEKTIGAGAVNNLLTENDFIEAEKDQVARLELISRNLKPIHHYAENGAPYKDQYFTLGYEELKYLGF